MTTSAVEATFDLSNTPRVPFSRLLAVELRKMIDTRAGKWLLGVIGLLTLVVLVIFLLAAHTSEHTFANSMGAAATPQGLLLPVLGIMLVTQEWGQRTGMVTFTLEPHRDRVLWVKVAAAIVLGLIAVAVALVLATLATAVGGAPGAFHGVGIELILRYVMYEILNILGGLVFGLLFLNTAGAIVASFAVPILFSIVTSVWTALHKAQPWIDQGTSQTPLQNGDHLDGSDWAHLASTTVIWVVVPFAIGMWRVLRAEVK
jgi:ABC-2 type transport system permease protein